MPENSTEVRAGVKKKACHAALLAGMLLYLTVFFAADAERWRVGLFLLIPDELLSAWMGGDPARIGILDRGFVLSLTAVILAVAAVIGRGALKAIGADQGLCRLEIVAFSLGTGLSLLSLGVFLVGLAGLLHHAMLLRVLLATGLLLAFRQGVIGSEAWRDSRGCDVTPLRRAKGTRFSLARHGVWLAAPLLVFLFLGAMMPPWEFDVREYHLQVPKEWFLAGRIEFLPHNVYGNMPLAAEMPALLAMVLYRGWADWWWAALIGKTVMAAFAPLAALSLYTTGRRLVSPTAGIVAALLFLATPWVIYVSMTGLNEVVIAAYSILAFQALLLGRAPRDSESGAGIRPGFAMLAGFLAGSAAACKYPALLFTVFPLFAGCLGFGGRQRWRSAALFLLAAGCVVGPWYAKNALMTGNPVYPLVFGGRTRTPERREQWNRAHQVPRDTQGRRYHPAQLADSLALVGWNSRMTHPLLLPLALLAAWVGRRQTPIRGLLAALLWVFLVWWLATHRVDRFLVPVLSWVALLAGCGFVWFRRSVGRPAATALLLAGLAYGAVYSVAPTSGLYDPRLLVSLTELRRDEPDEPGGPSRVSAAHRFLNDHLEPDQRVLLVGDAQPFDLEVPVLYNTCFDQCHFERLLRDRSGDQRREALQAEGISHVFIHWGELARYRSPGNYGYSDFVTRELVWNELVKQQGLLRPVRLEIETHVGEMFQVVDE